MKQPPKPPIHRENILGSVPNQDGTAHTNKPKLDDGGKRTGEWGPSLRRAVGVLKDFKP